MTVRKFAVISVALLLAIAAAGGSVYWASLEPPDFYEQAMSVDVPVEVRREQAKQFVEKTTRLVENIKTAEKWSEKFTAEQANSWLAEEFHQKHADAVPEGVHDPRVEVRRGRLRLGFRLEREDWNGVVSMTIRPSVVAPNKLALEIETVRAGLIPIPVGDILREVAEDMKTEGWRVEWRRTNGYDVYVVDLDQGEPEQPVLESVRIVGDTVVVSGSRAKKVDARGGDSSGLTFKVPRTAVRTVIRPAAHESVVR